MLRYKNTKLTLLPYITLSILAIFLTACNSGGNCDNTTTANSNSSGIIFGNNAGLLYVNNLLLSGTAQTLDIDANTITGIVSNHGSTYVATSGGKVYQYIESTGFWQVMPGNGAGYTLDGSSITVLMLNNNALYAATTNGNLFTYLTNQWNRVGANLAFNAIQTLTFDQNNNPYVGTQNGQVFQYSNGIWNNLILNSSVDGNGSQINSLAIYKGHLYAATSAGGVYKYESINQTWNLASNFTAQSVNSLMVFNDHLYAGTTVDQNAITGNIQIYDGSTWSEQNSPDTTPINILLVNNNTLYAASNGNPNAAPLINGQVYSYNGSSWESISNLSSGTISALTIYNGNYYAGTNSFANYPLRTVYTYNASMNGWKPMGNTSSIDTSSIIFSTAVDNQGNFYAGTLYNIYKYNPTIQAWLPLASNNSDFSGVSSISIYNNLIYATTFAGNVYYINSSNGWVQIANLPNGGSNLYSAVDNSGNLYVGVNSNNENVGNVWKCNLNSCSLLSGSQSYNSLDNSYIQSIATDKLGNVYAGTSLGLIWQYPVGGSTWNLVGSGTPDTGQVMSITTDSNNHVYIGTNQGNVFAYDGAFWSQLGLTQLDGSSINTVTFDKHGILHGITSGGNVWQFAPNQNVWINQFYGSGILLGSNTTPTATGF